MNPLDPLLRPVVSLINRQIAMTTPARELCAELEGKIFAIQVRNTAISMYFSVGKQSIHLSSEFEHEPDAIVSGSLISLASLASSEAAIRNGEVELRGDAELAQSFRQLLQLARPDLEEELSSLIGDGAAHGIGETARRIGQWSREARNTMRQNVSEYLQEESRTVPSRNEVNSFQRKVNDLRDDAARLDARIGRVESRNTGE